MENFPRQEDLKQGNSALVMRPALAAPNLRPVGAMTDPPTALDFQNLIAAISKLGERDKVASPGRRLSVDHQNNLQTPSNGPTYDPLRLRSVLDAIYNFCVSRPRGEVVALGIESILQRGTGKKWLSLIVATAENLGRHASNVCHLSQG